MRKEQVKAFLDNTKDPSRLKILQAFADGEIVQYYDAELEEWVDSFNPIFDFTNFQYRIKPQKAKLYMATWYNKGNIHWSTVLNYADATKFNTDGVSNFKIHEINVDG